MVIMFEVYIPFSVLLRNKSLHKLQSNYWTKADSAPLSFISSGRKCKGKFETGLGVQLG